MTQAAAIVLLALVGALVRGRAVAGRDPGLLDCARLLEALLACDLARLALEAAVLGPAAAGGRLPYVGAERAAFHLSQALFLAWPFGAAWLSWRLFAPCPGALPWLVGGAPWVISAARLALGYPALRGGPLGDAYRWLSVLGVCLALSALLAERPPDFRAGRAHLVSLFVTAGLAAELAGPYLGDAFASWWLAQATWIPVLVAVALAATWRAPRWGTRPAS